jgi:phospholipase C
VALLRFTVLTVIALVAMDCSPAVGSSGSSGQPTYRPAGTSGIHKIQHVVVVMQENRSFDNYFGTYPGADGIPAKDGKFSVCGPDPQGGCTAPYHNAATVNGGGPHSTPSALHDIDGGKMDGFQAEAEKGGRGCNPNDPLCTNSTAPDVMGYHDAREIPNYWTYAQNFVLQDKLFEPNASWSLPAHLFTVSEWSAKCKSPSDPQSCHSEITTPQDKNYAKRSQATPLFAWTDLTYLLHKANVPWGYYVQSGTEPDCQDAAASCPAVPQDYRTPNIWNPLPRFTTVHDDGQVGNIQSLDSFFSAAHKGSLPAVSWVVPSNPVSDHPPADIHAGQAYLTNLVNTIMKSPDWNSTAIFVAWDDWGGFYDHVVPPSLDENGYGLRVPGLVISPYAKQGVIDHQTLSFDAYAKFIEDDFLGGQRLDPKTDGRPDSRPTVRENVPQLGDLSQDFDFAKAPRPALLLPTSPPPGPASAIG